MPAQSQFFITYGKQDHLNGQNTIFGRVIDGAETTLDDMEKVAVGKKFRPLDEIRINKASCVQPERTLAGLAVLMWIGADREHLKQVVVHANPIADQSAP